MGEQQIVLALLLIAGGIAGFTWAIPALLTIMERRRARRARH